MLARHYSFGLKHNGYNNSPLTNHPYKYNGKELNEELGLDWYDYGARNYDAALARWMNLDPLADEYYDLSPYNYCAGNPINSIDVNGEWIYIMHENNTYKYDNGKLYQYQNEGENAYTYTEFSTEEGSFLEGVLNGINDLLSSSAEGEGIVNYFGNDDTDAFIAQNDTDENIIDLEGSNTIYLSPKLEGSKIPTENGIEKSEFWLDIGHELFHRQDILENGNDVKKEWLVNPTTGDKIPETEKYATHKENQIREATGMPLRTHYARQGNKGWDKSRIIDNKGNSLYYSGVSYTPLKKRKKNK